MWHLKFVDELLSHLCSCFQSCYTWTGYYKNSFLESTGAPGTGVPAGCKVFITGGGCTAMSVCNETCHAAAEAIAPTMNSPPVCDCTAATFSPTPSPTQRPSASPTQSPTTRVPTPAPTKSPTDAKDATVVVKAQAVPKLRASAHEQNDGAENQKSKTHQQQNGQEQEEERRAEKQKEEEQRAEEQKEEEQKEEEEQKQEKQIERSTVAATQGASNGHSNGNSGSHKLSFAAKSVDGEQMLVSDGESALA